MATPEAPDLTAVAEEMERYYLAAIARVRRAVIECGRTEAEIARRAGLAQSYINAIKHGRRDPSGGALFKLIGATGLDVAELAIEKLLP